MLEPEKDELTALRELRANAPESTFKRLKKRILILQTGRDLTFRQAFAFWMVLDAFLRIFFGTKKRPATDSNNKDHAKLSTRKTKKFESPRTPGN